MVSLTTVYIVSIVLTSIAGFGSAFAGNKMIGGGVTVPPPQEEFPAPSIEQTSQEVPLEQPL
jgi:hypothetical protein